MEGSQQFYGLTCNEGFGTGYRDMTRGVWCFWTMEITAILIIHFAFYSTVNCYYCRTARVTYTGQGQWFYSLWESYNLCLINKWWVHTTTHSVVSSHITIFLDRHVQLKIWNTSSLYGGFVTARPTGVGVLVLFNTWNILQNCARVNSLQRQGQTWIIYKKFHFIWYILFYIFFFPFSCLSICISSTCYITVLYFFSYQLPSLSLVIPPRESANRRATFISSVLSHTSFCPHSFISLLFYVSTFFVSSLSLIYFTPFISLSTWPSSSLSLLTTNVIKQPCFRAIAFSWFFQGLYLLLTSVFPYMSVLFQRN